MPGNLQNQVAWISGGASGMGEGTAKLFAREGAKVTVVDVNQEQGDRVVGQIAGSGGEAIFIRCDVSNESEVKDSLDQTVARFGSLQIIVNCAGIVHVKTLDEYTEAE